MRRRRLIGVYRGLLMSIWMPWLRFRGDVRGDGAWRLNGNVNMRRVHTGKLADRAVQHNRAEWFCCARPAGANHFVIGCLDDCVPLCKAARGSALHVEPVEIDAACSENAWEPMRERPAAPETARQA